MREGFLSELNKLYDSEGKDLFLNHDKLFIQLEKLQSIYPAECRKTLLAFEAGIVDNLIMDEVNGNDFSRVYMYMDILKNTYNLSDKDSFDIIDALSFTIFSKRIEEKTHDTFTEVTTEFHYKTITKIIFIILSIFLSVSVVFFAYNSSDDNFLGQFTESMKIIIAGIEPLTIDGIKCDKVETKINIDGEITDSICIRDSEGRYYAAPDIIKKLWKNVSDIKEVRRYGISTAKKKILDDNFYEMQYWIIRPNNKNKIKIKGYYEVNNQQEYMYIDLKEVVVGNLAYTYYIDDGEELLTIYTK